MASRSPALSPRIPTRKVHQFPEKLPLLPHPSMPINYRRSRQVFRSGRAERAHPQASPCFPTCRSTTSTPSTHPAIIPPAQPPTLAELTRPRPRKRSIHPPKLIIRGRNPDRQDVTYSQNPEMSDAKRQIVRARDTTPSERMATKPISGCPS